jgi:hypothetical protein
MMRNTNSNLMLAVLLVLGVLLACNFRATTANISGLKLTKDKNAGNETHQFSPNDTIYGVADISHVPDKVTVKGRLIVDEVEGQKAGPIPGLEDAVDLEGSGTATFTFSPPTVGWPKGRYKMEIRLFTQGGEQKDQEIASFSVS